MSLVQIHNILQPIRKPSRRLLIACAVLMAFAAAPLHGQYNYQDLHDFNCATDGCNPYDYGQLAEGKRRLPLWNCVPRRSELSRHNF